MSASSPHYDVFIVGTGPAACTFARVLIDAGLSVGMADIGAQFSRRYGENLKNKAVFQRDPYSYGAVIDGLMSPLSVAWDDAHDSAPGSFAAIHDAPPKTDLQRANPNQDPAKNLPGACAVYAIGGMGTHWTCVIPRHHESVERIPFITANEWDALYTEAERILNRHTDVYSQSARHQCIKRALRDRGWPVEDTPVASKRRADNPACVDFTGADTILDRLAEPGANPNLTVHAECCVRRLLHRNESVRAAVTVDMRTRSETVVSADTFVIAGGTIRSAQLLWNSGIRPPALGRYLNDKTYASCQIILNEHLQDEISQFALDARPSGQNVLDHDPPPHLYIPVSENRHWHAQIHQDTFRTKPIPPGVDPLTVVELRWFGMVKPAANNRVVFNDEVFDESGMPQPTFEFTLSGEDKKLAGVMFDDMMRVAGTLGAYLTGFEPFFQPLGASSHVMGATRMGPSNDGTSVADPYSKVWGFENLILGGNGLIPTSNAGNPTLTTVALALRSARSLIGVKNEWLVSASTDSERAQAAAQSPATDT